MFVRFGLVSILRKKNSNHPAGSLNPPVLVSAETPLARCVNSKSRSLSQTITQNPCSKYLHRRVWRSNWPFALFAFKSEKFAPSVNPRSLFPSLPVALRERRGEEVKGGARIHQKTEMRPLNVRNRSISLCLSRKGPKFQLHSRHHAHERTPTCWSVSL